MKKSLIISITVVLVVFAGSIQSYPLDAYEETGIRRIEAARLAVLGQMKGRKQPPGALLPTKYVDLRLLESPDLDLPAPDPEFTAQVVKLLGNEKDLYGMAVLDLSDPSNPRYAEYRGDHRQNVGSVGKIVAGLAIFQALADIYPDDLEARLRVLKESRITADDFIRNDSHTVRIWDTETKQLSRRPLRIGDQGTLWEFMDWTLSASSNAAASIVMQQAMLLVHFGKGYPASQDETAHFFKNTPKKELGELFIKTFNDPITRNGLNLDNLRQGSFFTRYGKQKVPGMTSYGTARELMLFTLRMEQGRLVDEISSRELKRLLYMTERRIRYASSPALADSAVYFKSGSLYSCKKEPGFVCKKYHGNVRNYMNSMAIVESPAGQNRLHYIATLISNVLRKNSAVEHQTLGTRIHRLIEGAHPSKPVPPGSIPSELTFGDKLIGYQAKQKERVLIAETQAALLRLGYPVGEVDGKLGPMTTKAIRQFPKTYELRVDGKTSAALLEKLNQTSASNPE